MHFTRKNTPHNYRSRSQGQGAFMNPAAQFLAAFCAWCRGTESGWCSGQFSKGNWDWPYVDSSLPYPLPTEYFHISSCSPNSSLLTQLTKSRQFVPVRRAAGSIYCFSTFSIYHWWGKFLCLLSRYRITATREPWELLTSQRLNSDKPKTHDYNAGKNPELGGVRQNWGLRKIT